MRRDATPSSAPVGTPQPWLVSGDIDGFASVVDNGTLVSNVPVTTTGNEDLDHEDSRSFNLGFVWDVTPRWNIGVDAWYLKNEDAVINDPQYILDNEADFRDFFTAASENQIQGGFAYGHFCNVDELDPLLKELKVTVRCIPRDDNDVSGKCFFSGKTADKKAIFAKAY